MLLYHTFFRMSSFIFSYLPSPLMSTHPFVTIRNTWGFPTIYPTITRGYGCGRGTSSIPLYCTLAASPRFPLWPRAPRPLLRPSVCHCKHPWDNPRGTTHDNPRTSHVRVCGPMVLCRVLTCECLGGNPLAQPTRSHDNPRDPTNHATPCL